ncbi:LOW QUALITY PROTEIN: ectin [Rhipicephalus microplus]|uniref:LOW QUALITY PROTEIN: ectin n=1 Tax=Rhipicephalus microplus TaxID=6941 RepID=UPI003F6BFCBC
MHALGSSSSFFGISTSARLANGGLIEPKLPKRPGGVVSVRSMKPLLAAFAVAIFGASVPTSCFIFGPRLTKQIVIGGPNGKHGMGGGGGGGPYEPLDFEGVFTRSMRKLQRQVLKHTNRYRRMHGVRALKEDEKLNRYAQAWALMMAKMDKMQHRKRPLHGENLYMYWSSNMHAPITGLMPVKSWYDEIKQYNYNNPGFSAATGHLTQLVWKDCRRIGTGVARGPKGTCYVVSVYEPRGNIVGQFAEQVPRPISEGAREGGGATRRGGGNVRHKNRWRHRRRHYDDDYDD